MENKFSKSRLPHVAKACGVAAVLSGALLAAAPSYAVWWNPFTWWSDISNAVTKPAQTKYPIVLVHGLGGYGNTKGADYWGGIVQELKNAGATVHVAQVSAFNSHEVRGEQLLTQVKNILATTGAAKVNLIGHSQGSPTARYVAGVAPGLVASVTSVGGVNRGSSVADAVMKQGSWTEGLGNAWGQIIGYTAGDTSQGVDIKAALNSLSVSGSMKFNQKFPNGVGSGACDSGASSANGIAYYSWTGNQVSTNLLDPSDIVLSLASQSVGDNNNDGLVSVCSSKLGQDLGTYKLNHLDEVNQMGGLSNIWEVSPSSIYVDHAKRLKNAGL